MQMHRNCRVNTTCGLLRIGNFSIPIWNTEEQEVLDLRRNHLHKLDVDKLAELPKLHTLFLTDNKIRHFGLNIFDVVPMLQRVYVGRNQLRNVPVLSSLGSSPTCA
uniref:Biglycan n=1 Tax=Ditylenchus dipsaci TaxID=166011 RepID=A0A915CX53_9BILA